MREASERGERRRAEAVLAGEKRALEMIARGEALPIILDALCRLVEALSPGSLASILLLDPDGLRLRHGAAPSLPQTYRDVIDGLSVGPDSGSCGTAAYRKEPVVVADVTTDPLWATWRDVALSHGLRACWSTPVRASDGRVLATVAVYARQPGRPTPAQQTLIDRVTDLASIAIERTRAEEERQAHLAFLEGMDRVHRATQSTNDLEQMMSRVLETVLSIFGCDRAWLVYPCDPAAASWRARMEHTRPEFPGAFALGQDMPYDPETAAIATLLQTSAGPVRFGPGSDHALPEHTARFGVQSMLAMVVHPKGDRPWALGLHQCSALRVWTPREQRLFHAIGRHLEDALTSVLSLRDLQESERRLEEAQRISHVGDWERDLVTGRSTWSDEMWRIMGLPLQRRSLTAAEVLERLHPADRARWRAAVADALGGRSRYDIEYRVVRLDGDVRFVRSRGEVLRNEAGQPRRLFGTVQDITERKLAEQRLLVQHAVTQILAAAATLGEATPELLRAVGECLLWDVGALWHVDRDAAVLRCVETWHAAGVTVPEFEAATRQRTFLRGLGLPGRVWFRREPIYIPDVTKDAEFLRAPIAAREALHAGLGVPIVLDGEVLAVMEFFSNEIRPPDQDVLDMMAIVGSQIGQFIERKRAEEALAHARAELAHVARVSTLGEISASIAHEINQPLLGMVTSASSCARWLATRPPNLKRAQQALDRIVKAGTRASEVIDRVRMLVKRQPLRTEPVDLNEVIREVVAMMRYELQRSGVALQTRLVEDLPAVPADRIQLQQVILNLMLNGIEATRDIEGRARQISIASRLDGRQAVHIEVRDSGVGLDPGSRKRLFEAFHTTKPHGLGMGLAISRSIVEAYGGRLWATDNEPRGAVFQFTLPLV